MNKSYEGNIYKFENKLDGKIYIGQSRCINDRYKSHVFAKNPQYPLDRAINKYGIENFDYVILETLTSYNLDEVNNWMDEREDYYISYFNSLHPAGYNLLSSRHHPEFSEITRQRISYACTGEKNGFYGRKHSEESKRQMSISAKARGYNKPNDWKPSEEQVAQWKVKMKKYWDNLSDEEYRAIIEKQQKSYKEWRNNMSEDEWNEWKEKRSKKSKETIEKRKAEGRIYKGSTSGKKAVNNGIIGKKVNPEELDEYLNNGWRPGALWNKHKILNV